MKDTLLRFGILHLGGDDTPEGAIDTAQSPRYRWKNVYSKFGKLKGTSPVAAQLLARRAERREGYIQDRAVKDAARRFE